MKPHFQDIITATLERLFSKVYTNVSLKEKGSGVRRRLARVTCVVGSHPATARVPVHPGQQLVRVLQVLCPPYRH